MNLRCTLAGHRAGENPVYNSGYYFGACRRCGDPLIRGARGSWRPVPTGHRVVWKSGRHFHSLGADYDGLLPIVSPELQLPAAPSPFVSWCRAMVAKAHPARRQAAVATVEVEEGDYRYPGLLVAAVLVGAGLKLLLGFGAGR